MNKFLFLIFGLFFSVSFFCQLPEHSIEERLKNFKELTVVKEEHPDFKEYYEIMIVQKLDHFSQSGEVFKQRIFVGFNNIKAPVVMETEGYALGNISKPTFIKDCNLISVEHRYFGKSVPGSLNWDYLTIKQAAYDLHIIRTLFGELFKGRWMSSGSSKGGQTAIAYKMYFPDDVDATLAYVTPLKKSNNDSRISSHMKTLSKAACGKKVFAFQKFAFRNKKFLLIEFDAYVQSKKLTFGKMTNERVFEYLLLEYPFAFFQGGHSCGFIPDTTALPVNLLNEFITVVPPRFFSDAFRPKLEPSFYMFYHELGYYEYDLEPYKKWLSGNSYPNNIFVPQSSKANFDTSYLTSINKFIVSPKAENIIFVYGELDPYTSLQAEIDKNEKCIKVVAKNGSHKSRIPDLSVDQQNQVFEKLTACLKWPVGY